MRAQKKKIQPARKRNPAKEMALLVHQIGIDHKALDAIVLDVRSKSSFTDYLVIFSGTSDRHIKALANHIEDGVHKALNREPLGVEGQTNGVWILVDYGEVVCHVFLDEARSFYRLEELWQDAPAVSA